MDREKSSIIRWLSMLVEPRWRRLVGPAVLLVAMIAVAYGPAAQGGFIWDDDLHVQNNQTLRSVEGLRQIWFEFGAILHYYPVVHTTFWIEYQLWELDPTGYHVVNILLHALGAVLLWRVLTLLQVPGAWAAAAIFALHPVHVESVAWIAERKNVLSGVFYLGAALAYLRGALGPATRTSTRFYAVSLALFLLALLSKTVTCTLPPALLLVVWWKRERLGWSEVRPLGPFFALGIGLGLLAVWVERNMAGAVGQAWDLSLVERCLLAGRVLCFYAGKLFWPAPLTFSYPRWQIDAAQGWLYVFPVVVAMVAVALWSVRDRLGRGPLVAILYFAGTLFPALGFFNVYPMRYSFVADHFQYLASAGLIALVAAAGHLAMCRFSRWGRAPAILSLVVVLATLGILTWRQAQVYRNLETLWRDTLAKNPDSWLAHINLGNIVKDQGKLAEAIGHYRRAVQLEPDYAEARFNLGNMLSLQGNLEAAVEHYRRALQIQPDYGRVHVNWGNALLREGNLAEAIEHYRQALQLEPKFAQAHFNLGTALVSQGNLEEAIEHYRRVVQLEPDFAQAHHNLGIVLKKIGQPEAAREHFREAARLRRP